MNKIYGASVAHVHEKRTTDARLALEQVLTSVCNLVESEPENIVPEEKDLKYGIVEIPKINWDIE